MRGIFYFKIKSHLNDEIFEYILFGNGSSFLNGKTSNSNRTRRPIELIMVGNEGFEPPVPDSESGALPLGEFPTAQVSLVNFGFLQVLSSARIFSVYCQWYYQCFYLSIVKNWIIFFYVLNSVNTFWFYQWCCSRSCSFSWMIEASMTWCCWSSDVCLRGDRLCCTRTQGKREIAAEN